jgi:quercetin dioxygenase-like cupin family protein
LGFVAGPEEGLWIDLPGWSMSVKVMADQTQARFAVVHGRMALGAAGAAGHIHHGHDETFIVLEGWLRFRLGDNFQTAVAGSTVFTGRQAGRRGGAWREVKPSAPST